MKRYNAILILLIAGVLWSLGGLLIKSIPWHPLAISGMRGGIAALVIFIYSRNSKLIVTNDKINVHFIHFVGNNKFGGWFILKMVFNAILECIMYYISEYIVYYIL